MILIVHISKDKSLARATLTDGAVDSPGKQPVCGVGRTCRAMSMKQSLYLTAASF